MATTTKKWDLKRVTATVALAGTLLGGLATATGWYSARIQADVQAETQKVEIGKRIDHLEDSVQEMQRKIMLTNVRSIRTEEMIETLLEERSIPVPPKSKTQQAIESELEDE